MTHLDGINYNQACSDREPYGLIKMLGLLIPFYGKGKKQLVHIH